MSQLDGNAISQIQDMTVASLSLEAIENLFVQRLCFRMTLK